MYSLEERIYFDGAAASDAAAAVTKDDHSSASSSASSSSSSSNANADPAASASSSSAPSTTSDSATSSAPSTTSSSTSSSAASVSNSTQHSGDSSNTSADSSASNSVSSSSSTASTASSAIDVNSLISAIVNENSASTLNSSANVLVVSSSISNASEILADAQAHNIITVSYNPLTETLTELETAIADALGSQKAASINFVTGDNAADGLNLVSASSITSSNLTVNSSSSDFLSDLSSLIVDGGRLSFSGDSSLTDSGATAFETAMADAAGVKVSFINSADGAITTAAPDGMNYNIVFVDSSITDASELIKNMAPNTEVYYLNSSSDGIDQITSILNGKTNVDSIQIIAHGNDGELLLGSTLLENSNIAEYSSELQSWGKSLTADGDILIYSCYTAETDSGKAFVNDLASITGADIAVSIDGTGGSTGNWTLEYTTGAIEASTAFDASDYNYHLAEYTVTKTGADDGSAGTLSYAVSEATSDGDLIYFSSADSVTSFAITEASALTISHSITISAAHDTNVTAVSITTSGASVFAISGADITVNIDGGSNATITLSNGNAAFSGITVIAGDTLNLDYVTFEKCGSTGINGGAINNAGILTLTNCTFGVNGDSSYASSNIAQYGGAIYNSGTLNISGGDKFYYNEVDAAFSNSSISVYGGAVYNTSTINISGTNTFDHNRAYIYDNTVYFTGSVINISALGGAIYSSGSITISGSGTTTFSNNIAEVSINKSLACNDFAFSMNALGGAIYTTGTLADTAATTSFTSNSAYINFPDDISFQNNASISAEGGAIYATSTLNFSGTSTSFTSNSAYLHSGSGSFNLHNGKTDTVYIEGGAIYSTASITFSGTTTSFTSNSAYVSLLSDVQFENDNYCYLYIEGGAIYSAASLSLTGTTISFSSNSAYASISNSADFINTRTYGVYAEGGAIYSTASLSLTGTTINFSSNSAYASISNSGLFGNTGTYGVYAEGGAIYSNNSITLGASGSGITLSGNYTSVTDTGISGTYTLFAAGGAVYLDTTASLSITGTSTTFAGNHAATQGNAVYAASGADISVTGTTLKDTTGSVTYAQDIYFASIGAATSSTFTISGAAVLNKVYLSSYYITCTATTDSFSITGTGSQSASMYFYKDSSLMTTLGGISVDSVAATINNSFTSLTDIAVAATYATTSLVLPSTLTSAKNITVTGNSSSNAYLYLNNAAISLANNAVLSGNSYSNSFIISGSSASTMAGSGCFTIASGSVTMSNLLIADYDGANSVVSVSNGASLQISGMRFLGNSEMGPGSAIYVDGATLNVTGAIDFMTNGSAINIVNSGSMQVSANITADNEYIYLASASSILSVTDNVSFSGTYISCSGKIYISSGKTFTISDSSSFEGSGKIYGASGSTSSVGNLTFAADSAQNTSLLGGYINTLTISSTGTKTLSGDLTILSSLSTSSTIALSTHGLSMQNASWTFTSASLTGGVSSSLSLYGNGTDSKTYTLPNAISLYDLTIGTNTTLALNGLALSLYHSASGSSSANSVITAGDGSSYAAGIINVNTGYSVSISGLQITHSSNSALHIYEDASATVSNCIFIDNHKTQNNTQDGGAVYLASKTDTSTAGASLTVSNTQFTSNYVDTNLEGHGGAIWAGLYTTLSISDSSFTNNYVTNGGSGGAIRAMGNISISGACTFTGNHAPANGGAIDIEAPDGTVLTSTPTISISGATFGQDNDSNYASSNYAAKGSSIYIQSIYTVGISNSNFYYNYALSLGGAVYNAGTLNLSGGNTFSYNKIHSGDSLSTISIYGGAVYSSGTLTISGANNTFSHNFVYIDGAYNTSGDDIKLTVAGGAIYSSGTLSISGSTSFSNNSVYISSTGDYALTTTSITLTACGGAVYSAAAMTIAGTTSFSSNSAYITLTDITGDASFVSTMDCNAFGGAIAASGTVSATTAGESTTFTGNSVYVNMTNFSLDVASTTLDIYGGALYGTAAATFSVGTSTWTNNSATASVDSQNMIVISRKGGAVYIDGSTLTFGGTVNANGNVAADGASFVNTTSVLTLSGASILTTDDLYTTEQAIVVGDTLNMSGANSLTGYSGARLSLSVDGTSLSFTVADTSLTLNNYSNVTVNTTVVVSHVTNGTIVGASATGTYLSFYAADSICIKGTFDTVTANNTAAELYLKGATTVSDLELTKGKLFLDAYTLTLANTGKIAGSGIDKSFIYGGSDTEEAAAGYITIANAGSATISGVYITLCSNSAVRVALGMDLTVHDATFYGNTGTSGAAIYSSGATIKLTGNAVFSHNSISQAASAYGGAIHTTGALTISGTGNSFTTNTASSTAGHSYGGAIYASALITVSGTVSFESNTVTSTLANNNNGLAYGGAIYAGGGLTAQNASNMTFTANSATGYGKTSGGAIYTETGTITFSSGSSSTFTNNSVLSTHYIAGGGAICNYNGTLTFASGSTSTFTKNHAASNLGAAYNGGGAIYNTGTATLNGCTFGTSGVAGDANYAGNGGAVCNYNDGSQSGTITLNGCAFYSNTASSNGGAVYNNAAMTLKGTSAISGNTATDNGSFLYTTSGILTLSGWTGTSTNSEIIYSDSNISVTGTNKLTNLLIDLRGTMNFDNTAAASLEFAAGSGFASSSTGSISGDSNDTISFTGTGSNYISGGTIGLITVNRTGVGNTITMLGNLNINGGLTLTNGNFAISSNTLTMLSTATISVAGNAALQGGSTSTIAFNGTVDTSLPSVSGGLQELSINTSAHTISLGANITISSKLSLYAGYLDLANYNLTLDAYATIQGNALSSSNAVISSGTGLFIKGFNSNCTSFTFPLATFNSSTGLAEYTPLTISFAAGAVFSEAQVSAKVTNSKYSTITASNYIKRYWTINVSGVSGANPTVTAQYLASDVTGTESSLKSYYSANGTSWTQMNAVDSNQHTFSGTASLTAQYLTAYTAATPTPTPTPSPSNNVTGGNSTILADPQSNTSSNGSSYYSSGHHTGKEVSPSTASYPTSVVVVAQTASLISDRISQAISAGSSLINGEHGIDVGNNIQYEVPNTEAGIGFRVAMNLMIDSGDYSNMASLNYEKHPLFKSQLDKLLDLIA